ncbi:hypothetical protein MmiAt1_09530 [Methanimicrococcus sp. At1]|uniref:Uncharacterized protein n=1 Tax=Methanimicrococcus hacksteinii TaxID=3028293 RepID=A0ABU3VPS3_9EURY|nr:hypothetical protein [Methanimicrococcus sp. At1]MDV0445376.1 hypothetical protein [Methanimicrococcus sp. At1]
MRHETFDEIFTYVGYYPDTTPEEVEATKKLAKEAREDLKRQIQRIQTGVRFDGTPYEDGEDRILFDKPGKNKK